MLLKQSHPFDGLLQTSPIKILGESEIHGGFDSKDIRPKARNIKLSAVEKWL